MESLRRTPETNITVHVNYTTTKKKIVAGSMGETTYFIKFFLQSEMTRYHISTVKTRKMLDSVIKASGSKQRIFISI